MENLMNVLNEQIKVKSTSTKTGYNVYFKEVLKNDKMTKDQLIKSVIIKSFKDKFNVEPSVEAFAKYKKEIEKVYVTINNSIDTSKSNSDIKNKGFYLEGLRLMRQNDLYYIEIVKK